MPATAKFLQAIAGLPQGAVVLPGLDTDLDDDAWQLIGGATDAHGKVSARRIEPSAIRDACAAGQIRPQAQRRRTAFGTPAPHEHIAECRGNAAVVERHGAMA